MSETTGNPTQVKLKPEYRARLKQLAEAEHRSLANMIETLIDRALSTSK